MNTRVVISCVRMAPSIHPPPTSYWKSIPFELQPLLSTYLCPSFMSPVLLSRTSACKEPLPCDVVLSLVTVKRVINPGAYVPSALRLMHAGRCQQGYPLAPSRHGPPCRLSLIALFVSMKSPKVLRCLHPRSFLLTALSIGLFATSDRNTLNTRSRIGYPAMRYIHSSFEVCSTLQCDNRKFPRV